MPPGPLRYNLKATPRFWASFNALPLRQQESARKALEIFKVNPFDPRLKTHRIHQLSTRYQTNVHSVWIEGDLRAVFLTDGNDVVTIDIGTHDIYK